MADRTYRILISNVRWDMESASDPDALEEVAGTGLPKWAVIEQDEWRHLREAFQDAVADSARDWILTLALDLMSEQYGFCVLDASVVLVSEREGKVVGIDNLTKEATH
jgi:hypothetical protein